MDTIGKMVGLVILMTFAVDCVVAGARSLLVSERIQRLRANRGPRPIGDKLRAQVRRNALLSALTGALCLAAVNFTDLRIAAALNGSAVAPEMDVVLTWIILVAGADRFRELMARMKGDGLGPTRKETPAIRLAFDNEGQVRALPKAV